MKSSALFLASILLFALGPSWAEAPSAKPESPPKSAAAETNPAAQAMEQWHQARQRLEAEVGKLIKDPKQKPLLADYRKALDETGQALEKLISLRAATPPADKRDISAAVDKLKQQLVELRRIEAKIKSAADKAPNSADLMSMLGKALSQQQEKTQSTTKKLKE